MDESFGVGLSYWPHRAGWVASIHLENKVTGRREHWITESQLLSLQECQDEIRGALAAFVDWGGESMAHILREAGWGHTVDRESSAAYQAWQATR